MTKSTTTHGLTVRTATVEFRGQRGILLTFPAPKPKWRFDWAFCGFLLFWAGLFAFLLEVRAWGK